MALRLSIDTTFLIDLQRERSGQRREGPALRLLNRYTDAELFLSVVAFAEFAEGFSTMDDPLILAVRSHHTLLPVDDQTARRYAGEARSLRSRGLLIGANDLWIGCSSLRYGLPLVTADVEEFKRLAGLEVIGYRDRPPE